MEPIKLPPAAEDIRKEIKGMILDTSTSSNPEITSMTLEDGNKTYLGDALAEKISFLAKEMQLGSVRTFATLFASDNRPSN